jgi:hypothetical protein
VLLALPSPGLAQDDTNAVNITDLSLWADMYQVMSGTSTSGTPDTLQNPLGIRTPKGIYAFVLVDTLVADAMNDGLDPVAALKNYFTFMLNQPEVAGILYAAPWSLLNPNDPNKPATANIAYEWELLDPAFQAIEEYNKNKKKGDPDKALQLNIAPGFSSPPWLFDHMTSCDELFTKLNISTPIACGYTDIFVQTEVPEAQRAHTRLPLPWNQVYHTQWKRFLKAMWDHINDNKWETHVVSVAVAGPSATSSEIMLPNENDQADYTPLVLPPTSPFPPFPLTNQGIGALSAWNCLLANNYGVDSSYLNSNRAFIEEWDNALDMFGEIFSEVTLTITTGNGLPNFTPVPDSHLPGATFPPGCGLLGIGLPKSTDAAWLKLLQPHPAFESDCGPSPLRPMDCPAEVAILAYFAEPPVGGPNAKSVQENALSASDDNVGSLLSLSNASVKWLAKYTDGVILLGPQPSGGIGIPLASRIMGGLQFNHAASASGDTAKQGCPAGPTSPTSSECNPYPPHPKAYSITTEQAIFNTLRVFFAGTSGGGANAFDGPTTIKNNDLGVPIKDAPMNYLQVWADDIKYAAGFGHCLNETIFKNPTPSTTLDCYADHQPMPPVTIDGKSYTAEQLLQLASAHIPTTEVAYPLCGYNKGNNQVPTCESGYFKRKAFDGDLVCVSESHQDQFDTDSKAKKYGPNFSTNDSDAGIAYGRCKSSLMWRQAYMGDYVCVSASHAQNALADNEAYFFGVHVHCP